MTLIDAMPYIWVAVIALAAILEAVTTSLVSIWFIPGAVVAIILALFSVPVWIQTGVFFILAILMLVLFRKMLKKRLWRDTIPTNADSMIGMDVVVTETVSNLHATGLVKLRGVEWRAVSSDDAEIEAGAVATVERIDGVKLVLKKKQ